MKEGVLVAFVPESYQHSFSFYSDQKLYTKFLSLTQPPTRSSEQQYVLSGHGPALILMQNQIT